MRDCLNEEALQGLSEGWLSAEEVDAIHRHVACCAACCALLGAVGRTADPAPERADDADPFGPILRPARFEIRRCLGRGGFGTVHEAFDRERSATVALKVLHHEDPAARQRFKQEFRLLSGLLHPNLVTLYELLSEGRHLFFTMELVRGRSFIEHVRGHRAPAPASQVDEGGATSPPPSPPLLSPWEPAAWVSPGRAPPTLTDTLNVDALVAALLQLAEGLQFLHAAGRLHRDIKPSNLLVSTEGRVVLLDFGLAAELEPVGSRSVQQLIGTPAYMSPEQALGLALNPASDWYSVGVVLHEALTGTWPFQGTLAQLLQHKQTEDAPPLPSGAPGAPEALRLLCSALLQRRPELRPTGTQVIEQVSRLRASRPAAPRPQNRRQQEVPLVGRRPQLALLDDALRATREGSAGVVLCHGASGMGKSALCRHFLQRAREAGPMVLLAGRCYEHEEVPFKALDGVVDALCRYLQARPTAELLPLVPREAAALCRLFPGLLQVPALAAAPPLRRSDAQQARRAALLALRELLQRLADRSAAVVVFIDDLQWGDLDSIRMLLALLEPPDPPALLLCLAYRSEDARANPVLRALQEGLAGERCAGLCVQELEVDELRIEEAEELVRVLLPGQPEGARALAKEAQGNPFFLHELCLDAADSGEGNLRPTSGATVESVIRARVARLPDAARRLLTVACLAGQPLERGVLARAAYPGQTETDEPQVLTRLRAERLLRSRRNAGPISAQAEEEFLPYHDRIREAVVVPLTPAEIREVHRRLIQALEASGRAEPEQLVYHHAQAGEPSAAARHAALAARQAQEVLAFDRAARLGRLALSLQALAPEEEQALQALLGDALSGAGRPFEAAAAYLRAAALSPLSAARGHHQQAMAQLLCGGYVDEGLQVLQRLVREVGLPLPATPLLALLSLLWLRLRLLLRGLAFRERRAAEVPAGLLLRIDICRAAANGLGPVDPVRCANLQARHLLLALRAGEPYRLALALALEGAFAVDLPRRRRIAIADRAMTLAERVQEPRALATAWLCRGAVDVLGGEFARGEVLLVRAEAVLAERCTAVTWERDSGHFLRLLGLSWQGEMRQIATLVPALLRDASERGDRYAETMVRLYGEFWVRICADQPDEARRLVQAALALWSKAGPQFQHVTALRCEVTCTLYDGRRLDAWRLLDTRWSALIRSGPLRHTGLRVQMRYLHGQVALAATQEGGLSGPRLRAAAHAARVLRGEDTAHARPLSLVLQAALAQARGQAPRALRLWQAAEEALAEQHMGLHAAGARRCRGALLGGGGGAALVAEADVWMADQGIQDPVKITRAVVPS